MEAFSYYTEDSSLAALVGGLIEDYADERRRFWEQGEDGRADPKGAVALAFLDDLARHLLKGATDLTVPLEQAPSPLPWSTVRLLGRKSKLHVQIKQGIELSIARELADVASMSDRLQHLLDWLLERAPNETTLRFLRRMARCYIAGFDPETLVMCRAVLENAVKDVIDTHKVPVPPTPAGKSEMRTRLNALTAARRLTSAQSKDALAIWTRGSKAAHEDPHATTQVFETVTSTLGILERLYEPPRASAGV